MDKEFLENVLKELRCDADFRLETGFVDLDEMLAGIKKGNIISVGGRPAMGKTSFLISILQNLLKKGNKCLFFSYEMDSTQFMIKFFNQFYNIGSRKLREKISTYLDDFEKKSQEILDLNLVVNDNVSTTIEDIKTMVEKEKPDFVFIDYLQLMPFKSKRPRTEIVSDIMDGLKQIAEENDSIFFINSQLSRALESRNDKRPMLSDFRESGSIEEFSDAVLFIYREDYYNFYHNSDDETLKTRGNAEIIIAKNKFGPCGVVELLFVPETQNFCNVEVSNVF